MKADTCKHFNGILNDACDIGVRYNDVTPDPQQPGRALRLPCFTRCRFESPTAVAEFNRRLTCPAFELPTDAEIEADEQQFAEAVSRLGGAIPLILRIKKEHRGHDWSGTEKCPACGASLHLSHAPNGHVWAKCDTDGCISFIE